MNNKNHFFLLILFILFVISFLSCKDEHIRPVLPLIELDPELKAYMSSFGEGSMWIYEEENTGELDTMRLVKNQRVTKREDDQFYAEGFWQNYKCTNSPEFAQRVLTSMHGEFYAASSYNVGGGYSITKKNGIYSPEVTVKKLDSVYLKGKLYTEVLRIYERNDINYTELLFAKNIGMIKRVAKNENFTPKPFILKEYYLK